MSSHYNIINAFESPDDRQAQLWLYNSGYRSDPEFDQTDYHLYKKAGKATLVFRSTDVRNASDLLADTYIMAGKESKSRRFQNAENVYRRAVQKYGANNVDLTGFSLGGSQALYLSNKYKAKATVFNPGFSPEDLEHHLQHPRDYSNATAYVTAGDVISNSILGVKNIKKNMVYDTKTYKDITNQFAPGIIGSAAGVPTTSVDVGTEVLKRGAEIAQPELIPLIEAGSALVKGVGTAVYASKDLYNMHSLKSMKPYFGEPKVEPKTESFQSGRYSSELESQIREMETNRSARIAAADEQSNRRPYS